MAGILRSLAGICCGGGGENMARTVTRTDSTLARLQEEMDRLDTAPAPQDIPANPHIKRPDSKPDFEIKKQKSIYDEETKNLITAIRDRTSQKVKGQKPVTNIQAPFGHISFTGEAAENIDIGNLHRTTSDGSNHSDKTSRHSAPAGNLNHIAQDIEPPTRTLQDLGITFVQTGIQIGPPSQRSSNKKPSGVADSVDLQDTVVSEEEDDDLDESDRSQRMGHPSGAHPSGAQGTHGESAPVDQRHTDQTGPTGSTATHSTGPSGHRNGHLRVSSPTGSPTGSPAGTPTRSPASGASAAASTPPSASGIQQQTSGGISKQSVQNSGEPQSYADFKRAQNARSVPDNRTSEKFSVSDSRANGRLSLSDSRASGRLSVSDNGTSGKLHSSRKKAFKKKPTMEITESGSLRDIQDFSGDHIELTASYVAENFNAGFITNSTTSAIADTIADSAPLADDNLSHVAYGADDSSYAYEDNSYLNGGDPYCDVDSYGDAMSYGDADAYMYKSGGGDAQTYTSGATGSATSESAARGSYTSGGTGSKGTGSRTKKSQTGSGAIVSEGIRLKPRVRRESTSVIIRRQSSIGAASNGMADLSQRLRKSIHGSTKLDSPIRRALANTSAEDDMPLSLQSADDLAEEYGIIANNDYC